MRQDVNLDQSRAGKSSAPTVQYNEPPERYTRKKLAKGATVTFRVRCSSSIFFLFLVHVNKFSSWIRTTQKSETNPRHLVWAEAQEAYGLGDTVLYRFFLSKDK
jgi:hypothetical protein